MQRNQRKHCSFCSLVKQPIPGSCTRHLLQAMWQAQVEHDSKPTEEQRSAYAFRPLDHIVQGHGVTWTVWTPTFPFGAAEWFLSWGQSLCVPAGSWKHLSSCTFQAQMCQIWIAREGCSCLTPPSYSFRLRQQFHAVLVLPAAVLGWQLYPCGAKGRGIPALCLQSLCSWLWLTCVLWKIFMPQRTFMINHNVIV